MPEELPRRYRKSSQLSPSYSYTDIATGLGVNIFYLATTGDSGGNQNPYLTDQELYSGSIETKHTTSGSHVLNFDTAQFNNPRTTQGTAYLNIGIEYTTTARLDITLQKVATDGTTTTNLSSTVSTYTYSGGSNTCVILLYPIPITTTATIATGEKLRLKIDMVMDATGDGFTIGHDPAGRDGTEITPSTNPSTNLTKARLYMPFVIDT